MTEQEFILTSLLDCRRVDLLMDRPRLSVQQRTRYQRMQMRRFSGEPLQYVTGHCEFMGLKIYVDRRVLIPRPETEILVDSAVKHLKSLGTQYTLEILDLGSGSGNIAIALAKNCVNSHITSVDVSGEALELAKHNARMHEVNERIDFIEADMNFLLQHEQNKFDCIISNPPYIPTMQIDKLPIDVQYEPLSALDGGQDGLDFYRVIITSSHRLLKKSGVLFLEIGDGQAEALKTMVIESSGYQEVKFYKDYVNTDRILQTSVKLERALPIWKN